MLSTRNILHPATGEPAIGATQDMVLGCYYLTMERQGLKGEGRRFADRNEALLAFHHGVIDLQAKIQVRLPAGVPIFRAPNVPSEVVDGRLVETTAGRIIFNE